MNRNELLNANADQVTVQDLLMTLTQMTAPTEPDKRKISSTLKEWETYLEFEDDKSDYTIRNYKSQVKNFDDWAGEGNVEDVTKMVIKSYKEHLLNAKGLKPTSVNLTLISLNQFFVFCVDKGYIQENPARGIKKVKQDPLQPKSLDKSTVAKLRNAIKHSCQKKTGNNHLMMFDFMLGIGLRVSEVVKLRFRDVIDEPGHDNEGVVIVRDGKGEKYREVYMPDELLATYREYKANMFRSRNESQFIFMHNGEKYSEAAIRTCYWRLCREWKIKHVSPHALRHTYAINHLKGGTPPVIVQSDLGHANFSTTARYQMPSTFDKRASRNNATSIH